MAYHQIQSPAVEFWQKRSVVIAAAAALILVGGVFRYMSLGWNTFVHGDVALYSEAAQALGKRGEFRLAHNPEESFFYDTQKTGGRMYEYYPLWPLIGAIGVKAFGLSGFSALKAAGFLSGMLLLLAVFLVGRRIGGNKLGIFSLALASFSYALIDFSANGSFYMLQGALYLFFVFVLLRAHRVRHMIAAGALMGVAILLNFQSIILLPSLVLFVVCSCWGQWGRLLRFLAAGIGAAAALFAPWGIRNYFIFDSPFFTLSHVYVWNKLGVEPVIQEGIISYHITLGTYKKLLRRVFTFWLPHNLYFINRKLFVLAPLTYVFSLFFLAKVFVKDRVQKKDAQNLIAIVPPAVFHVLISAVWPIAKFRFFIPLLPFVFIMGGWGIFAMVHHTPIRRLVIGACIVLAAAFSFLTYAAVPSHTYYYDGVLTTDNFGKSGEYEFIRSMAVREQEL